MQSFGETQNVFDVSDKTWMPLFQKVEGFFPKIRTQLNESSNLIL